MSMLRFKVSELEAGHQCIQDINKMLAEAITATSKENQSFSSIQSGAWAEAQARASVNIETNARIFNQAMARIDSTFVSLVSDARAIQANRDALLSEVGASTSSGDEVRCDTEGRVDAYCATASSALSDLLDATDDAISALTGLREASAVSNALSLLASDLSREDEKVDSVLSAWSRLQSSAVSFESTYSGSQNSESLDKSTFIDEEMVTATRDAMTDEYSTSGAAVAQAVANSITKNFYYKYGKKTLGVLGKALGHTEEFKTIGKYGAWVSALASGDKGAFLLNLVKIHPDNDHFFDRSFLIAGVSYSGLKTSIAGAGTFGSRFAKELKESGIAAQARGAYKSFEEGGKELKAYFSVRFCKDFSESTDDLGEAVATNSNLDNAISLGSGTGKIAKGAGKALGVVADVVAFVDTFQKSKKAYETTSGDRAQKKGADPEPLVRLSTYMRKRYKGFRVRVTDMTEVEPSYELGWRWPGGGRGKLRQRRAIAVSDAGALLSDCNCWHEGVSLEMQDPDGETARRTSFSSVDFYPSGDLFSALLDIPDYPESV